VSFDDFYVVEPASTNPHDILDHLPWAATRSITHEEEPVSTSDYLDGWMFQHILQYSAPNASFYVTEVYRPSATRLTFFYAVSGSIIRP
jgi:hypothetical protein